MQRIPTEDGIARALAQLVKHLERMELAEARAVLRGLAFHRLLDPVYRLSKGKWVRVDLVARYGTSRVTQTAAYIADCEESVGRGRSHRAYLGAIAAQARWTGQERDLKQRTETKASGAAA